MTASTFENLDLACAKAGKSIAEKLKQDPTKNLTNALAVLEEQGVYALFLFLQARGGEDGKDIGKELHAFLQETPRQPSLLSDTADVFAALQELGKDLDKLLLARDLLRQTLVYARYHARAEEK